MRWKPSKDTQQGMTRWFQKIAKSPKESDWRQTQWNIKEDVREKNKIGEKNNNGEKNKIACKKGKDRKNRWKRSTKVVGWWTYVVVVVSLDSTLDSMDECVVSFLYLLLLLLLIIYNNSYQDKIHSSSHSTNQSYRFTFDI